MALVKLEIDGKRVMADGSQTILQVARQHGIDTIPTLCHDEQLEPFASCFVCVVKVKGARTLVPACSTKVTNGMVVETNNARGAPVAQGGARAAALGPLRRLRRAVPARVPGGRRHPGLHRARRDRQVPGRHRAHQGHQPAAVGVRARLHAALRGEGLPPHAARRGGRHRLHQALHQRPRPRQRRRLAADRSRRPTGGRSPSSGRARPGSRRPTTWPSRGYDVEIFEAQPEAGRHAALRHPRVPPAQGRPRPRDRPDPRPRRRSSRPTPPSAATSPSPA